VPKTAYARSLARSLASVPAHPARGGNAAHHLSARPDSFAPFVGSPFLLVRPRVRFDSRAEPRLELDAALASFSLKGDHC